MSDLVKVSIDEQKLKNMTHGVAGHPVGTNFLMVLSMCFCTPSSAKLKQSMVL